MNNRLVVTSFLFAFSLVYFAYAVLPEYSLEPLEKYVHNNAVEAGFAELIKSSKPVILKFYAPWCQPCKRITPALSQLAGQLQDKAKCIEVNIDTYPKLAAKFMRSIPTILIFKNSQLVLRLDGRQLAGIQNHNLVQELTKLITPLL